MTSKNVQLTKLLKNGILPNPRAKVSKDDDDEPEQLTEQKVNPPPTQNINRIDLKTDTVFIRLNGCNDAQFVTGAQLTSGSRNLRNIMHAFGDSSEPIEASIDLMEMILRLELGGFLYLCDSAVAITGSKVLGLREAIFTMKNEKHRLLRLFKYFATKDQQMKLMRQNQINNKMMFNKSYVLELRIIIESIDETGEMLQLLTAEASIESAKTEKALRADRQNLRTSLPHYVAYAKARSVSFARKLSLLHEWVRTHLRSEYRLSQSFMEVMAFLTYELVAHIVDLTFIVRREKFGYSNPITRLCDPRGANPDTCTSAPAFQLQKKRKDDECNNVSEILVQASEMEAKRMKKVTNNVSEMSITRSAVSLTPDEIREAYIRLQAHSQTLPSQSYKSRADRRRKLQRQY